jgi:hypothetical protein
MATIDYWWPLADADGQCIMLFSKCLPAGLMEATNFRRHWPASFHTKLGWISTEFDGKLS